MLLCSIVVCVMMQEAGDSYAVREIDKAQIGKGWFPELRSSSMDVDVSNFCQDMTLDFLNI